MPQIGANISIDDNEVSISEMIFEHGGYLDKINDFDWNQNKCMMCASIDDINNLQKFGHDSSFFAFIFQKQTSLCIKGNPAQPPPE